MKSKRKTRKINVKNLGTRSKELCTFFYDFLRRYRVEYLPERNRTTGSLAKN